MGTAGTPGGCAGCPGTGTRWRLRPPPPRTTGWPAAAPARPRPAGRGPDAVRPVPARAPPLPAVTRWLVARRSRRWHRVVLDPPRADDLVGQRLPFGVPQREQKAYVADDRVDKVTQVPQEGHAAADRPAGLLVDQPDVGGRLAQALAGGTRRVPAVVADPAQRGQVEDEPDGRTRAAVAEQGGADADQDPGGQGVDQVGTDPGDPARVRRRPVAVTTTHDRTGLVAGGRLAVGLAGLGGGLPAVVLLAGVGRLAVTRLLAVATGTVAAGLVVAGRRGGLAVVTGLGLARLWTGGRAGLPVIRLPAVMRVPAVGLLP